MIFERTDYLSWYLPRMRRRDGSIPMHASGMAALDPASLVSELGNPWDVAHRFEQAVADWQGVGAEQVVAVPGGTGGTLLALLSLVEPGRAVWIEAPHYEPMVRQSQRLAPVSRFQRRSQEGWALPMGLLRSGLASGAGMVILTEPNNPGGVFAPEEQVLELAEHVGRAGGVLLINEVYRDFSTRPTWFGRHPSIVVVSSLSKLCGLYWARVGWLVAPPGMAQVLRSGLLNFGMGTQPGCAWGLPVLRDIGRRVALARAEASACLPTVSAWAGSLPGIGWVPPQGPGFGALQLPAGVNDVALAERLHDDFGVLTVPGTLFEAPGTLRISWMGLTQGDLEEGLRRLDAPIRALAHGLEGENS